MTVLLHTGSHGRGFHRVAHSNAMLHTGLKSRSCQHSQCASRRVSRSASASHCSAHSIGFVTLWMLANPFFGFVSLIANAGVARVSLLAALLLSLHLNSDRNHPRNAGVLTICSGSHELPASNRGLPGFPRSTPVFPWVVEMAAAN